MTRPTPLSTLVAGGALLALAACGDATAPNDSAARAIAVAPDLLVAVADAESRVAPSLDDEARAPMRAALGELRAALAAGDAARGRRAVALVRALVAGHRGAFAARVADGVATGDPAPSGDADDADLAAVALLAAVAESALTPGVEGR